MSSVLIRIDPVTTQTTAVSQAFDPAGLCWSVMEHAPLPMAVVQGPSHSVHQVNEAFCRLMGKPRDKLVEEPFAGLMLEKDQCLELLDRVYRTGEAESHTEREQAKARSTYRSYTVWPLTIETRSAGLMILVPESPTSVELTRAMNEALVLGSVHQHRLTEAADEANAQLQKEISERKLVAESLRVAQVSLAGHAKQLEELIAERTTAIAHHLRAPLHAMQGFSELLRGDPGTVLSETGRHFAQRIGKSAQFMDAMLNDLLVYGRVSQQNIELVSVNLLPVVETVLSSLNKTIEDKSAQTKIAGSWPAVLAHESTLALVLFSLVSNALKFVTPGVSPLVRLWPEERAEFIRIWIEDNGTGIELRHQAAIFGLFNRLDGEKYAGTGVGLAIAKKGLERMGGRVGVESRPGQGSRFWFELRKA